MGLKILFKVNPKHTVGGNVCVCVLKKRIKTIFTFYGNYYFSIRNSINLGRLIFISYIQNE